MDKQEFIRNKKLQENAGYERLYASDCPVFGTPFDFFFSGPSAGPFTDPLGHPEAGPQITDIERSYVAIVATPWFTEYI